VSLALQTALAQARALRHLTTAPGADGGFRVPGYSAWLWLEVHRALALSPELQGAAFWLPDSDPTRGRRRQPGDPRAPQSMQPDDVLPPDESGGLPDEHGGPSGRWEPIEPNPGEIGPLLPMIGTISAGDERAAVVLHQLALDSGLNPGAVPTVDDIRGAMETLTEESWLLGNRIKVWGLQYDHAAGLFKIAGFQLGWYSNSSWQRGVLGPDGPSWMYQQETGPGGAGGDGGAGGADRDDGSSAREPDQESGDGDPENTGESTPTEDASWEGGADLLSCVPPWWWPGSIQASSAEVGDAWSATVQRVSLRMQVTRLWISPGMG
jgi:hypothetical protein